MKIQHNKIAYLIPIIIIFFLGLPGVIATIGGLISLNTDALSQGGGMTVFALLIVLFCWINYKTNTLELKNNIVQGKQGLIRKITLSTAVSNLSYCEYKQFLCFNRIRINSVTGLYIFKNMKQAKEFTELVNQVQGR